MKSKKVNPKKSVASNQAKKSSSVAKKAVKKGKSPSAGKSLQKYVDALLSAHQQISPNKAKAIALRPVSNATHIRKFNLALQSFADTKGFEFDGFAGCNDNRPPDAPTLCTLPGDSGPTMHTKQECCQGG